MFLSATGTTHDRILILLADVQLREEGNARYAFSVATFKSRADEPGFEFDPAYGGGVKYGSSPLGQLPAVASFLISQMPKRFDDAKKTMLKQIAEWRPLLDTLVGALTLRQIIAQLLLAIPGTPHWSVLRNTIGRMMNELDDTLENRELLRQTVTKALEDVDPSAVWKDNVLGLLPQPATQPPTMDPQDWEARQL